jgi:acyl CoA:acetate/3-ketoacid CoA transferase alpha subunit
LLELLITADIVFLKAFKADEAGNLVYRNRYVILNPIMTVAVDKAIANIEEIVEIEQDNHLFYQSVSGGFPYLRSSRFRTRNGVIER